MGRGWEAGSGESGVWGSLFTGMLNKKVSLDKTQLRTEGIQMGGEGRRLVQVA